jgi:hypothetical protein
MKLQETAGVKLSGITGFQIFFFLGMAAGLFHKVQIDYRFELHRSGDLTRPASQGRRDAYALVAPGPMIHPT